MPTACPSGQCWRKSHQLQIGPVRAGKTSSPVRPSANAASTMTRSCAIDSASETLRANESGVCSWAATVPLGTWCSSTRVHGRRNIPATAAA